MIGIVTGHQLIIFHNFMAYGHYSFQIFGSLTKSRLMDDYEEIILIAFLWKTGASEYKFVCGFEKSNSYGNTTVGPPVDFIFN
jgi:hypothetical protein